MAIRASPSSPKMSNNYDNQLKLFSESGGSERFIVFRRHIFTKLLLQIMNLYLEKG